MPTLNDQAEIAADAWQTAVRVLTDRPLGIMLRDSRGGRNLIEIGQENDIDLAAQIDKFDIVPELDLAAWRIRARRASCQLDRSRCRLHSRQAGSCRYGPAIDHSEP